MAFFSWQYQTELNSQANKETLWAYYADVKKWPKFDEELEWVQLDGPFASGTKGILKPRRGPKAAFQLIKVIQHQHFSDISFLPLTKLIFSHDLSNTSNGSLIKVNVQMKGLLTPLFKHIIGMKIKKYLPVSLATLSQLANNHD